MSSGKVLSGILSGAAAGALSGILFAPDKGSETRRKMNEKGKKFTDDIKDKFSKGKEKFNEFKEDFEKKVKETAEEFA